MGWSQKKTILLISEEEGLHTGRRRRRVTWELLRRESQECHLLQCTAVTLLLLPMQLFHTAVQPHFAECVAQVFFDALQWKSSSTVNWSSLGRK